MLAEWWSEVVASGASGWAGFDAFAEADQEALAAVSALAAALAALAAFVSARITAGTIREMRAARQQATQPHVVVEFPGQIATTLVTADTVRCHPVGTLMIRNEGVGLALRPEVSIRFNARESFIMAGAPMTGIANLRPARGKLDLAEHHGLDADLEFVRPAWTLKPRQKGKMPIIRPSAGGVSVRLPDMKPDKAVPMGLPDALINEMLLAVLLTPYGAATLKVLLTLQMEVRYRSIGGLKMKSPVRVEVETTVERTPGTLSVVFAPRNREFEPQWELAATNWDRKFLDGLSQAADVVFSSTAGVQLGSLLSRGGRPKGK